MNAYTYNEYTGTAPTTPNHDKFYHSMHLYIFFLSELIFANQQLHSNVIVSLPIDIDKYTGKRMT